MTKKMGRPSSFDERLIAPLLLAAEKGAKDEELAAALGVSTRTFSRWKSAHPDFCQALKNSKSAADDLMEESLYEAGLAGNTTAQIFWLKNRRPAEWRDVHKIDVSGTVKLELPTPEEAKQILEADYAVLPAAEVKVEDLD